MVLLISATGAYAAGVDLLLPKAIITGFTTETQTTDIVVRNNENKNDTFTLSLFPNQFEKVTASLESFLLTMTPGEERTVKLMFYVPIDAEPQ